MTEHNEPPTTPQPNSASDFYAQAGQIYAGVWLPAWADQASRGDSPPEDRLACALETLLGNELRTYRLTLERHANIEDPRLRVHHREIDILVSQPHTGARMGFEVSAWSYHAATEEQWTDDVQRMRELRRIGLRVEPLTTLELRENIWTAALEAVDLLQDNTDFDDLDLPEALLAMVRSFAGLSEQSAGVIRIDDNRKPPAGRDLPPAWEEIRQKISALPSTWSLTDPGKQRIRAKHSRAYEMWESCEEDWLREAYAQKLTRAQMAGIFGRQQSAVDRRLRTMGLGPAPRLSERGSKAA